MATKKKTSNLKMRVSQGDIAKHAIHNIGLLYRNMGLSPKSVKRAKSRLLAASGVPTKLIEQVAAVADQHGKLAGMTFDSDHARQAIAYAAAFEPVAVEAEAFAQRVRDSIIVAKSDAGSSALAIYAALKGFVRRPEGAELRGAVDRMAQIMKDRRKAGNAKLAKQNKRAAANAPVPAASAPTAQPATSSKPADKTAGTTNIVVNTPGGVA